MIVRNLLFALRHLAGNLTYSLINIVGMSIGLACCLLILLYVSYESSYDRQWGNADRIQRVSRDFQPIEGARARVPAMVNAPVGPALMADFPEQVLTAARVYGGSVYLETGDIGFDEATVRFADQALFDIFDFEWLAGDRATALTAPTSIVLTESLARKYFGTLDVIGQTLRAFRLVDLQVTGVIADLPPNTHLDISGLVPLNILVPTLGPQFLQSWDRFTDFHTYLVLNSAEDSADLQSRMPDFLARHASSEAAQSSSLVLMPITDIHLRSDREDEWLPPGNIGTIRALVLIAFSILAIACINFMSIATARSTRRAKEIGMRKTIGATRAQLVGQFLAESALTVLLALIGAIALVELLLPTFSAFAGIPADAVSLLDFEALSMLAALLVCASIMAGAWPAFFLSSFQAGRMLRGGMNEKSQRLRNTLVIIQFAIAITLVVATLVVNVQLRFIENFNLGFTKDEVVVLRTPAPFGFGEQWPALKQALLMHPAIEEVTASHYLPFGFNDNQIPLKLGGSTIETRIQYMEVDYGFFETYEIDFLAGRSFSEDFVSNEAGAAAEGDLGFIVNQSAARMLGLTPEEAVNARLEIIDSQLAGAIVGVTDDIYFESFRLGERPLVFILAPPQVPESLQVLRDASIRVTANALPAALAHIDATWTAFNPGQPANRRFLEQDFEALYQTDERQGELLTLFASIAIAIACFGLFGLASFNAERRTKEIGVRKVMGGSVWSIVLLLTNDFSKLVLLSNLIAWPVAYFAMNRWLENFAYRIDLTPLIFIGSGLIALCIAWVTVGGTAAKAASMKPVLALRYE